jgi:enhancer of polycomb-like protein
MPQFQAVEHLFSSPVPASFYPAYEVPKGLPDSKALTRMARNVYPHWRQRREIRKGKSIFPGLNYDEANDGDPYVCFRRRDIRATRKTRRTDNYSVDKFQKLQYELQTAHQIVSMVQQRERSKQSSLRLEKGLWEAKWKLFETKRKWPSLGLSREEEEVITGRSQQQQVQQNRAVDNTTYNGAHALQQQSANVPQIRKKQTDREKDERERRERAIEMARAAEKGVATGGRSMAPESLKERALALKQRLDEVMSRRNASNAEWDDFTDVSTVAVSIRTELMNQSSYQPLPRTAADKVFRTHDYLVPNGSVHRDSDNVFRPAGFRLRRGRGGLLRLDRRPALDVCHRGKMPTAPSEYSDWLFPDSSVNKDYSARPKSIEDALEEDEDETEREAKRRRLNEVRRYDVDSGGAVGVGMGTGRDDDRVVIDDLDAK